VAVEPLNKLSKHLSGYAVVILVCPSYTDTKTPSS